MGNNFNKPKIGYIICPTEDLKKICLDNNLLVNATIAQCSKIFEANDIEQALKTGHYPSLHELISMVWLCSDHNRDEIARMLIEANNRYLIGISDKSTVGEEVVA